MKSPLLSLQQSIYDILRTLPYSVYDAVPESAEFPYITIGEDTAVDWSTYTEDGQEITHTIHVWSQYNGMKEVKTIIDSIVQEMTTADISFSGFYVVLVKLDNINTLIDQDGITRHGIVRFRFLIEEGA